MFVSIYRESTQIKSVRWERRCRNKLLLTPDLNHKYICSISGSSVFRDELPVVVVSRLRLLEAQSAFQRFYSRGPNFSQIRCWINECETQHGVTCRSRSPLKLYALKVIDCDQWRIVDAPLDCKYAALSYVWGTEEPQVDHHDCIDLWEAVPQTVEDSICVTKKLGYRYLWVDRYCIDQNSTTDKHHQIAQMGDIYAGAQITIIAAAGTDSAYGLPGVSANATRQRRFPKHTMMGSLCLSILPAMSGIEVPTSKWATRAWTFQEGFLSRKKLIFTDWRVIFVCNSDHRHEKSPPAHIQEEIGWLAGWQPRIPSDYYGKFNPEEGLDPLLVALECLAAYSARTLSFDSDALDAVSGVLNALIDNSIYHLWGIPFRHGNASIDELGTAPASLALLWYHGHPARRRSGFPSWSFLGWNGSIKWNYVTSEERNFAVNTHHVKVCTAAGTVALESSIGACPSLSHTLEITASTANLRVIETRIPHYWFAQPKHHGLDVVVSLNNELKVAFHPQWDIPHHKILEEPFVKGIHFPVFEMVQRDHAYSRRFRNCVMLVRRFGNHFERIGIFWIQDDIFSDRSDFMSRYYRSHTICDWSITPISLEDKRIQTARTHMAANPFAWWRDLFKEDTIMLG